MKRTALAFGSFIVGAICGSFPLSLIHTSTRVQAFQESPPAPVLPPSTITMLAAIPVVPPLEYFGHGDSIDGVVQQLDGFSCEGCTIRARILTYGGGAFRFPDSKIPVGVPIVLTGAALNTLNLLRITGVIPPLPSPRPVPLPGGPIIKAELEIKAQPQITFVSLEGVKK